MSITIDTTKWHANIGAYAKLAGQNMRESLYQEWPLLMEKIIAFTPPKTLAQGRAATARDLAKTMRPFNPQAIRTKKLRKIVDEMDVRAFNILAQKVKSGPMAGAQAVRFNEQVHTSQRDRSGRVRTNNPRPKVILGDNVAMLTRYRDALLKRVGWAKAGWLAAYNLVGGGKAPNFVTRHPTSGGAVIDDHANEDNPSITAINRTPWASRKDEGQRIIRDAINSRANAIETKIKVMLKLAREKARFGNAA